MSSHVKSHNHQIDQETRLLISKRYQRITKAINSEFWNSNSETAHSRYVGSYGRGTAIDTSDLDVLHVLPTEEYDHFTSLSGNGQSRLLQAVKNAILSTYPTTSIKGDGQVVVVRFADGMIFEILPAFENLSIWGWDGTYKYPDSNMGGNWMSTNPIAEQNAMRKKNSKNESNGLLIDTCRHIRYVRDNYYSSYHLSGILIDSFIYAAIGYWHWLRDGESSSNQPVGTYEQSLFDYYNNHFPNARFYDPILDAPGSNLRIDTGQGWDVLGKVLQKMV